MKSTVRNLQESPLRNGNTFLKNGSFHNEFRQSIRTDISQDFCPIQVDFSTRLNIEAAVTIHKAIGHIEFSSAVNRDL